MEFSSFLRQLRLLNNGDEAVADRARRFSPTLTRSGVRTGEKPLQAPGNQQNSGFIDACTTVKQRRLWLIRGRIAAQKGRGAEGPRLETEGNWE